MLFGKFWQIVNCSLPGFSVHGVLQYSYLKNPMDRGAWSATGHGVTKESDITEVT